MPDKRRCTCQHCYRHFDYVHHLHRHAIMQHDLGYRVDADTGCVVPYRPTNLRELQDRYHSWQGHGSADGARGSSGRDPRSASDRVSSSVSSATQEVRSASANNSLLTSRSDSGLTPVAGKKRALPPSSTEDRRVAKLKSSRTESIPINQANSGQLRVPGTGSNSRTQPMVNILPREEGRSGSLPALSVWLRRCEEPTAAIGKAPGEADNAILPSLDDRIQEILQPPRNTSSPVVHCELADASFGSFGLPTYPLPLELELGPCPSPPTSTAISTSSVTTAISSVVTSALPHPVPICGRSILTATDDVRATIGESCPVVLPPAVTSASTACPSMARTSLTAEEVRSLILGWPSPISAAWHLIRPSEIMPLPGTTKFVQFEHDYRLVRRCARVLAALVLTVPDIDGSEDVIPASVSRWLYRFFR